MKPALRTVPATAPPLREITPAFAATLYPHSPELQRKWLAAIATLRAGNGWMLDQRTGRKVP